MKKQMPSGGKRQGAGRPKGEPTETVSFRVDSAALAVVKEMYGRELNSKINAFIQRLSKTKPHKSKN